MRSMLAKIMLVSTGFSCFLALNSFSLWGFSLLPQTAIGENARTFWTTPLSLSNTFMFIVICFCASRNLKNFIARLFNIAIFTVLSTILLIFVFPANASNELLLVSGSLMGVGTTCCFFCWTQVFSDEGLTCARTEIVLGSLLSALPYLAFFTLNSRAISGTFIVLALLNMSALFVYRKMTIHPFTNNPNKENRATLIGSIKLFWKPLLCLSVIGFAAPIIAGVSFESLQGLSFIEESLVVHSENIIAAVILGVAWLLLKREVTIVGAFMVAFPVITTALLVYIVNPQIRFFVPYASGVAFVIFSILAMIESIAVGKRNNLNLTIIYGLFGWFLYGSNRLGDLTVQIGRKILQQDTSAMIIMFVILYACSLALFFITRTNHNDEQDPFSHYLQYPPQVDGNPNRSVQQNATSAVNPLIQSCKMIGKEYHLSERQTEVLILLAYGYDTPTIAEKLFVSKNTVRTHAKKIYAALHVHSKQEIIELANASTKY